MILPRYETDPTAKASAGFLRHDLDRRLVRSCLLDFELWFRLVAPPLRGNLPTGAGGIFGCHQLAFEARGVFQALRTRGRVSDSVCVLGGG